MLENAIKGRIIMQKHVLPEATEPDLACRVTEIRVREKPPRDRRAVGQ